MVGELTIPGGIAATNLADAAAGDADALARIVGAHHDDMARICYVICGDQDAAQDAVQAAWPISWRKLGPVGGPGGVEQADWALVAPAREQRRFRTVGVRGSDRAFWMGWSLTTNASREPSGDQAGPRFSPGTPAAIPCASKPSGRMR